MSSIDFIDVCVVFVGGVLSGGVLRGCVGYEFDVAMNNTACGLRVCLFFFCRDRRVFLDGGVGARQGEATARRRRRRRSPTKQEQGDRRRGGDDDDDDGATWRRGDGEGDAARRSRSKAIDDEAVAATRQSSSSWRGEQRLCQASLNEFLDECVVCFGGVLCGGVFCGHVG